MKKYFILLVLGVVVLCSGCFYHPGANALIGGATGAIIGGAVAGEEGAIVGGAIGGALGWNSTPYYYYPRGYYNREYYYSPSPRYYYSPPPRYYYPSYPRYRHRR